VSNRQGTSPSAAVKVDKGTVVSGVRQTGRLRSG
jgi:hypothetical protein